jgi:cytochrome P450
VTDHEQAFGQLSTDLRRASASGPVAALATWDDCVAALADARLVSDPHLVEHAATPSSNLLFMEGRDHLNLRRLVAPWFSAGAVDRLADGLRSSRDALLVTCLSEPSADLVSGLARPLVLHGLFDALGIADHHRSVLAELLEGMSGLLDDRPDEDRRHGEQAALRATMVFQRDAARGTAHGIHAELIAAAKRGDISAKQAQATPAVLLHGGYENPLNQLGQVLAAAAADPSAFRDAAEADPAKLFEEVLRKQSPARKVLRWATDSLIYGDVAVARGDPVWIEVAKANVDRVRFPPDRGVEADRLGHLGFGRGRHGCIGAPLARLLGVLMIEAILLFPNEVLAGAVVQTFQSDVTCGVESFWIVNT